MSELACKECVHVWCIQRRRVVALEAEAAALRSELDSTTEAHGRQANTIVTLLAELARTTEALQLIACRSGLHGGDDYTNCCIARRSLEQAPAPADAPPLAAVALENPGVVVSVVERRAARPAREVAHELRAKRPRIFEPCPPDDHFMSCEHQTTAIEFDRADRNREEPR